MLCLGFCIFVCEYAVLPINDLAVYIILAPVGEELVKSSVLLMFLVSFIDCQVTREQRSKVISVDSSIFFMLLLYVITIGEVFYPDNPLSGVELFLLTLKKFAGHFALTVLGCMVFGFLYQRRYRKRTILVLIGVSVTVSVLLHSLVNQIGLQVFLGTFVPVSPDSIMGGLFVLSVVLICLFLVYRRRIQTRGFEGSKE
jgi:hypothetical protein